MPPKDKKEKPKSSDWVYDETETIIIVLFLLVVAGSLVNTLSNYVLSGELSFYGFRLYGIVEFFRSNALFLKIFGFAVAGAAAIGAFIFTQKGNIVWREEKAKIYPENMPAVSLDTAPPKNEQMGKWDKIIKLSESENPSDWRLAIIEADIMLDELLEKLELPGDTMGDKLKVVEKSDFTTIDLAWEAHKFRNNIAHQGNDFLVNQREIRRIISLYDAVFKEFFLI